MNGYFGKTAVRNNSSNINSLSSKTAINLTYPTSDKLFRDPINPYPKLLDQNNGNHVLLDGNSENFCVSLIDIVGSTKLVSTINSSKKIRDFYGIFINSVASILKKYDAKIIKTVGDGIISYFPETKDTTNLTAFENVVNCSFAQMDERSTINNQLREKNLPTISYRVSIDYGKVERAQFKGFDAEDLFGSTVNFCSKINLFAPPNSIIIGSDLYQIMRSLKISNPYKVQEMNSYYCGAGKFSYPLYLLSRVNLSNFTHTNPLNRSTAETKKYVFDTESSQTQKILLIDDKKDDLMVLEHFLKLEGFEVRSFSNPRQALLHYANTDPSFYDLIISDIRMPEINGFQLYYKLKSIKHDIKILFATCLNIAEELLVLLPEVKPEQIIQKPVGKERFIEIVRKQIL